MNEPIENDRLIAFLDILGFEQNYDSKKNILLELLKTIRQFESDFRIEHKDGEQPGSQNISIIPSCLGFSDSIIIAIPLKLKHDKFLSHERVDLIIPSVMLSITSLITNLYVLTLSNGFSLRGAIAYGDVYYDKNNRIITGRPLMEAIKSEGKIAKYPRIIISHSILKIYREYASSHINSDGMSTFARRDFDGLHYVDWLRCLMRLPFGDEEKSNNKRFKNHEKSYRKKYS